MKKFVSAFGSAVVSAAVSLVASLSLMEAAVGTIVLGMSQPAFSAGGSDVPFPLDYPLPFPWNSIEGVWEIESRSYHGVFKFDVESDCSSRQILRVQQIHPHSNRVIAAGLGYKIYGSEQVTAAMSGKNGSYMLYVGAYEDTHVKPSRKAYVLRIVSFEVGAKERRFKIRRVSNRSPRQNGRIERPECVFD